VIRPRPARTAPEELLERRYRRLLAWYPAAYRAANAEEMLGVALAAAPPGRRWPSLGESASLVLSGVRLRLRLTLTGLRGDAWQGAAALVALIGPVLIATIHAESVTGALASGLTGFRERPSVSAMVLTAGWSLVAVAAWLRWRRTAAVGASLGAIGEAAHLAVVYPSGPPSAGVSWQLVLAGVTALAALTLVARPEASPRPLTRWALTAVLAAALVLAAFPIVEGATTTVMIYPDGAGTASSPLFGIDGLLKIGLLTMLALAVLVAVLRSGPAARRRVMVLAAPVAAVAALAGRTPGAPWPALVVAPAVALAGGLVMLARYEGMLRRVRREGDASRGTS
jgi:hypothetical protein